MDNLLCMGTFPRHGHITGSFFGEIYNLFKKREIYPLQENNYLAFWNKKYSGDEKLIDPLEIDDIDILEELDVVQPDFMFFKENTYIQNHSTLRTAGIPDLVVEIWSKANTKPEKDMKFRLYSSSESCEHWYLTQNSNIVKCWKGLRRLDNQTLEKPLKTTGGIVFDLTHLAL